MGRAHEVRAASMAKTAAMKSKLYAKYGKEIFMAAKSGVPDPNTNLSLRKVIEKAKKENVPADVIKRAIEKAKGGSEENYTEIRYEGFGPGNVLVVVDCMTDNTNRTYTEVRTAFNKTGGKLGVAGCAMHMFSHSGYLVFDGMTEDEVLEALLMADCNAKDIVTDDDCVVVTTEPDDFDSCRDALLAAKPDLEFIESKVTYVPMTYVDLDEEHKQKFDRLMEMLQGLDDVDEVYHNANE